MSYYEDVYLARLNRYGTTKEERIMGAKQARFENFLANHSIYKVEFILNYRTYLGVLEPGKGDEKDILSYMLVSKATTLETGDVLKVNNQQWIVVYADPSIAKGYNKYKVYLMDRLITWWDKDNTIHTAYGNFNSSLRTNVAVSYKGGTSTPLFRNDINSSNIIMAFDADLKEGNYLKIDNSDRRFVVIGFDIETVPNVQYVTLSASLKRDDPEQIVVPTSFWTGEQ